jgi:hypothetical protein
MIIAGVDKLIGSNIAYENDSFVCRRVLNPIEGSYVFHFVNSRYNSTEIYKVGLDFSKNGKTVTISVRHSGFSGWSSIEVSVESISNPMEFLNLVVSAIHKYNTPF